jgi:hypothetical protein
MLSGRGNVQTYSDTPAAQQVRYDYFRTGAAVGGVGEGAWAAGTCEMLVNGVPNPVTFSFGPQGSTPPSWQINRVVIGLTCLTAPGPIEFANAGAALGNGLLFRIARAAPAETTNLMTLLVNSDFMKIGNLSMNDDGANAYLIGSWESRVILHAGDTLDIVVQDDMTILAGPPVTLWAYAQAFVVR